MATTDISICSSALLLAGDDEISALPGSTRSGKVCANIYENTKLLLLASHPWRFAIGQASLNKLTATPLFDEFDNAFSLPANFQRIIRAEKDTHYKIYERNLYSNEASVNIEYEFIPDEADFPAYFTRPLELKMASLLSVAIAESKTKSELFAVLFKEALISAKAIDNQSKKTDRIKSDVLINVRTVNGTD